MGLRFPIRVFQTIFNACTLQRFNPGRAKAVTTANGLPIQSADPAAMATATQQQGGISSSSPATGITSRAQSSSGVRAPICASRTIRGDVTGDASTSAGKAAGTGSHPSVAHPPSNIGGSIGRSADSCVAGPSPDPWEVATSLDGSDAGAPDGDANPPAASPSPSQNQEESASPDVSDSIGQRRWKGYSLEGILKEEVVEAKKKTKILFKLIAKLIAQRIGHLALGPCRVIYALMRAGLISATAVIAWIQRIKVTYPLMGAILVAVIMTFLESIKHLSM